MTRPRNKLLIAMIGIALVAIGAAIGNELVWHWEVDRLRQAEVHAWREFALRHAERANCLQNAVNGVIYLPELREQQLQLTGAKRSAAFHSWAQEAAYHGQRADAWLDRAEELAARREATERRLLLPH